MRTAYLTLDEVNAYHAIRIGSHCGQAVHLVDLRSPDLGDEPFLVLDLDYLPSSEHSRPFEQLLPRLAGRLAVHSYNMPARTVRRLVRSGVVVRRRLGVSLFRRMRDRAQAPQVAPCR